LVFYIWSRHIYIPAPMQWVCMLMMREAELMTYGIVGTLYLGNPCPGCGLRQRSPDGIARCLDVHYAEACDRAQPCRARSWYPRAGDWPTATGWGRGSVEAQSATTMALAWNPGSEEGSTRCPLCGECFEESWDDESEQWLLVHSTRDPQTGIVMHSACQEAASSR